MVSETGSLSHSLEEYLTDDEIEEYLENLKTKIPSFIVELLKNNLKNRRLTKSQLDRVVTRVTDLYLGKRPEDKKVEELTGKINELSKKLDTLMKVAALSSATKISEGIKEEITKLEEGSEEELQAGGELEDEDSSAIKESEESQTPQDELEYDKTEKDVEPTPISSEEPTSKLDIPKKTDSVSTTINSVYTIINIQTPQDELEYDKTEKDVEPTPISSEEPTSKSEMSKKTDSVSTTIDIQTPQDELEYDKTEKDVESTPISSEEPTSKSEMSKKTDSVSATIDAGVISMANGLPDMPNKKYRLEELPEDTLSTMLVFKWLEFLISRVGLSNLIDILDYYYNLGWISEKVVNRLIKISKNMKYLNEEFRKPMDKMISEDHIVSLLYIEKLAGRPIPVDELESMNREVNRIKKWVEELQYL